MSFLIVIKASEIIHTHTVVTWRCIWTGIVAFFEWFVLVVHVCFCQVCKCVQITYLRSKTRQIYANSCGWLAAVRVRTADDNHRTTDRDSGMRAKFRQIGSGVIGTEPNVRREIVPNQLVLNRKMHYLKQYTCERNKHTHTWFDTHEPTRTHICTSISKYTHSHFHENARKRKRTQSHSRTHSYANASSRTHTHTHTHTRADTYQHTQLLVLPAIYVHNIADHNSSMKSTCNWLRVIGESTSELRPEGERKWVAA